MLGLRHVALKIKNFDECVYFYETLLKMKIVWQPDPDNVYLSSGTDNLALHRATDELAETKHQSLDHFGFFLATREAVDEWHEYLKTNQVNIKAAPKDHRDGTRSFYCADPDGNVIQFIFYPN
jgi:catechol 2,3-dioxygenase-like lactoylglutathione lyase family enzyme